MKKKVLSLGLIAAAASAWGYMGYRGWTWIPVGMIPKRKQIRVACVGDSITYGMLISNWFRNNYPAQLQRLLGDAYVVHNYGFSSATAMRSGNLPYIKTIRFYRSLAFFPNVVMLKFGTNDSKEMNWQGEQEFIKQYEELLLHYLKLSSHPVVYILLPASPQKFEGQEGYNFGVIEENIQKEIEGLRKLAQRYDLPVIDIHSLTENRPDLFAADGVHPNAQGARVIAEAVMDAMKIKNKNKNIIDSEDIGTVEKND